MSQLMPPMVPTDPPATPMSVGMWINHKQPDPLAHYRKAHQLSRGRAASAPVAFSVDEARQKIADMPGAIRRGLTYESLRQIDDHEMVRMARGLGIAFESPSPIRFSRDQVVRAIRESRGLPVRMSQDIRHNPLLDDMFGGSSQDQGQPPMAWPVRGKQKTDGTAIPVARHAPAQSPDALPTALPVAQHAPQAAPQPAKQQVHAAIRRKSPSAADVVVPHEAAKQEERKPMWTNANVGLGTLGGSPTGQALGKIGSWLQNEWQQFKADVKPGGDLAKSTGRFLGETAVAIATDKRVPAVPEKIGRTIGSAASKVGGAIGGTIGAIGGAIGSATKAVTKPIGSAAQAAIGAPKKAAQKIGEAAGVTQHANVGGKFLPVAKRLSMRESMVNAIRMSRGLPVCMAVSEGHGAIFDSNGGVPFEPYCDTCKDTLVDQDDPSEQHDCRVCGGSFAWRQRREHYRKHGQALPPFDRWLLDMERKRPKRMSRDGEAVHMSHAEYLRMLPDPDCQCEYPKKVLKNGSGHGKMANGKPCPVHRRWLEENIFGRPRRKKVQHGRADFMSHSDFSGMTGAIEANPLDETYRIVQGDTLLDGGLETHHHVMRHPQSMKTVRSIYHEPMSPEQFQKHLSKYGNEVHGPFGNHLISVVLSTKGPPGQRVHSLQMFGASQTKPGWVVPLAVHTTLDEDLAEAFKGEMSDYPYSLDHQIERHQQRQADNETIDRLNKEWDGDEDEENNPERMSMRSRVVKAIRMARCRPIRMSVGGELPQIVFRPAEPHEFIAARDLSKRKEFLSALAAHELADKRLFLSTDGKVGYMLDRHGDFGNLFNNGGPRGAGHQAILHGIANGAKTLDCFDGFLPHLYSKFGFVPTGAVAFNDEYAPPGWDYATHGRPDVILMSYVGGTHEYRHPGKYYTDFDLGKSDSRRAAHGGSHDPGARRAVGDRPLAGSGGAVGLSRLSLSNTSLPQQAIEAIRMARKSAPVRMYAQKDRGTDVAGADARMQSANHITLIETLRQTLQRSGLTPHRVTPAIHDVQGNARASAIAEVFGERFQGAANYGAAWQGLIAKQPQLVVFRSHDQGADSVYKLPFRGPQQVMGQLLDHIGVANRVFVPHQDGSHVYIYDRGRQQREAIGSLAGQLGLTAIEHIGNGESVGGGDDLGRDQYRDQINRTEGGQR